jgi:signal transduction histidine kinase
MINTTEQIIKVLQRFPAFNDSDDIGGNVVLDVFDKLPFAILINRIIYDSYQQVVDLEVVFANQYFSELYNIPIDVISNKRVSKLFSDYPEFKKDMALIIRINSTSPTFNYERNFTDKSKWYQIHTEKMNDDFLAITFVDVSDSKKMQLSFANVIQNLEEQLITRTTALQETIDTMHIEIAERKSAEEQLLTTKEELRVLLSNEKTVRELKDKFLNILTFEFRDPLTVLRTSIDLLRVINHFDDKSQVSGIFDRMENSIEKLINSMENVHLISAKDVKFSTRTEDFELVNVIGDVIEEIRVQDEYRHKLYFSKSLEYFVLNSDKLLIQAVMRVLLSNACQYSDTDSEVITNLTITTNSVIISVEDFGIGIPNNELPLIFEPLYRASNASTFYGSGVGLSIVKKYSQMLDAEIHVISKENVGTKFIISIPRYKMND